MRRGVAAAALLLLARPAVAQTFTNVTADSGLEAIRASRAGGYWMSGLLFIDVDGDGDLDMFWGAHHGEGGMTSLNDGRGHFTLAPGLVLSEIHIPYDADEDGKLDVVVTEGDGGGRWWFNASTPGTPSFRRSSIYDMQPRTQFLVDINRDGKADWLVVGSGSGSSAGPGTRVYLGDGKGGFAPGATLPVGFTDLVDLDGDGDKDALSARGNYPNSPPEPVQTRVFRNDGDMGFTDVTAEVGLAVPGLYVHGWGDVDQDGDNDLIGLDGNGSFPIAIYLNDGKGFFTKKPNAVSGPTGRATAPNPGLATVADLDNDGVVDILIGGLSFFQVLRGTGGGNFVPMNKDWGGITSAGELPDAAFTFGDIDGDGDLDIANYRTTQPQWLNLYRNDLPRRNWIDVRVVGQPGNRGAIGSWVRVYQAGTDRLLWFEELSLRAHQVQLNTYASGETERHFGLGDRTLVDVAVQFYPSNKVVKKSGVAANTTVRIGEDGAGTVVTPPAQPLPPRPAAVDAGPADAAPAAPSRDARPAADADPPTATGSAPGPAGVDAGGPARSAGAGCVAGGGGGRPAPWPLVLAVGVLLRCRRVKGRGASPARDGRARAARRSPPAPSVIIDGAGRHGHLRGGGEATP